MKIRCVLATVLTAMLVSTSAARAHGNPEWDAVRLALLTWGNALLSGDAVAMDPVLHADFRDAAGTTRDAYLERVRVNSMPTSALQLGYAFHDVDGDHARIGPLVAVVGSGMSIAWDAELVKSKDGWQLLSLAPAKQVPDELLGQLPEHAVLHPVAVRLKDVATGQLVGARVHVADAAGEYWPPQGHMKNIATGWREDVGRDVHVGDETWAYVAGSFTLPVPDGSYTMKVMRGLEYEPAELRFQVSDGKVPELEVALRRWIDMAATGWYSGDTHVHVLDPSSAMVELEGEDLNVINILATKWGELITNVEHFSGGPSLLSEPNRIVYVNEETRHSFLGHTVLLDLEELVYPLTWGGPSEGVFGGYDFPPMAYQADKAHAQGAHVSWAHFPGPRGEVAIDVALGKIDSVDLFTWGDPFLEVGGQPSTLGIWYGFLDCGFDLPATAGTDKMLNTQVSGSVRTYVEVDGGLTYGAWIENVRRGRTFVTTGPILELAVDGKGIGSRLAIEPGQEVEVLARVRSRLPVTKLEIVQDGRVVERIDNPQQKRELELRGTLSSETSSWIAARAYSPLKQPYQIWDFLGSDGIPVMAHTSPIYLDVAGAPRRSPEDAAFFIRWCDRAIEWARTRGRFLEESQREEMIALFERARAIYAAQLDG